MVQQVDGEHNGHAYVDMGLSVKWATCNVGASSPGDYGDYYAWGEIEQKQHYGEDKCQTWEKEMGDIGGTSMDVAHVKWGGSWRMPTEAEFKELLDEDNCTWTWWILGYIVRSKKTGNWIFLPAAGFRSGTLRYYAGYGGDYWSSTSDKFNTQLAYNLYFMSDYRGMYWSWNCRCSGLTVRPVGEF